jgi:RHS repeat-associated protein
MYKRHVKAVLNPVILHPFGSCMANRGFSSASYRYGFNGQEKDNEVSGEGNTYTAQFWEYDSRTGRRLNLDPRPNLSLSIYACFENNPLNLVDFNGDSAWVYFTTLPGAPDNILANSATHSFLVVKTNDGKMKYYAYGAKEDGPFGTDQLVKCEYQQDKNVLNGTDTKHLKLKLAVPIPEGMTEEQLDQSIINNANQFGNNPDIKYNAMTNDPTTGNCHTSITTILFKSGISQQVLDDIEDKIPGLNWGFGETRPWTTSEQKAAVDQKKKDDEIKKEQKKWDIGPKY